MSTYAEKADAELVVRAALALLTAPSAHAREVWVRECQKVLYVTNGTTGMAVTCHKKLPIRPGPYNPDLLHALIRAGANPKAARLEKLHGPDFDSLFASVAKIQGGAPAFLDALLVRSVMEAVSIISRPCRLYFGEPEEPMRIEAKNRDKGLSVTAVVMPMKMADEPPEVLQ